MGPCALVNGRSGNTASGATPTNLLVHNNKQQLLIILINFLEPINCAKKLKESQILNHNFVK
jgi:hypothetical protein